MEKKINRKENQFYIYFKNNQCLFNAYVNLRKQLE